MVLVHPPTSAFTILAHVVLNICNLHWCSFFVHQLAHSLYWHMWWSYCNLHCVVVVVCGGGGCTVWWCMVVFVLENWCLFLKGHCGGGRLRNIVTCTVWWWLYAVAVVALCGSGGSKHRMECECSPTYLNRLGQLVADTKASKMPLVHVFQSSCSKLRVPERWGACQYQMFPRLLGQSSRNRHTLSYLPTNAASLVLRDCSWQRVPKES